MARGRDTSTLRIDRRVREEIIRGCDQPELLREVFERARGLAFGRGTIAEFFFFCNTLPCILWEPDDPKQRHVDVHVKGIYEPQLVHIARVVWTVVATLPAMPLLTSEDEVLHRCGKNGAENTARGSCLNPGHMIRGNAESRVALRTARTLLRTVGMQGVEVGAQA